MPGDIGLDMPVAHPESVDSRNDIKDLSGIDVAAYENPYDALIDASSGDPVRPLSDPQGTPQSIIVISTCLYLVLIVFHRIPNTDILQVRLQSFYATHRTTRNSIQRAKLLSPDFSGLLTDPILQKLADPSIEPGFTDQRHCFVFWGRPPSHIRSLAGKLQQKLLTLAPRA
jgi:hypothetical protein